MTSIVGYLDEQTGAACVGSDSRAIDRGFRPYEAGPKWVRAGRWHLGVAGELRGRQLVERRASRLEQASDVYDLVDRVEGVWRDGGIEPYGAEWPCTLLVVHEGIPGTTKAPPVEPRVWRVDDTLAVLESGLVVAGSGQDLTLGAFEAWLALRHEDAEVRTGLELALAIAGKHDIGCGGPFDVRRVDWRRMPANGRA